MNTIEHNPLLTQTAQPLVSIITVVRNGEDTLHTTIDSVINQTYPRIEYIIIDGKSTDRTVEIIQKYTDKIAYWVSEPDRGIADAWNKGISACTGDLICILNAGDTLPLDYVSIVANQIPTDRAVFCYPTAVKKVDEMGKTRQIVNQNLNQPHFIMGMGILHPGCFATRQAFETVGKFSLQYRIAIDSDWIFRCYRAGVTFQKIDANCMMLEGGVSGVANLAAYGEYLQAMRNNGFSHLKIYTSMVIMGIRGLVKSILRRG